MKNGIDYSGIQVNFCQQKDGQDNLTEGYSPGFLSGAVAWTFHEEKSGRPTPFFFNPDRASPRSSSK